MLFFTFSIDWDRFRPVSHHNFHASVRRPKLGFRLFRRRPKCRWPRHRQANCRPSKRRRLSKRRHLARVRRWCRCRRTLMGSDLILKKGSSKTARKLPGRNVPEAWIDQSVLRHLMALKLPVLAGSRSLTAQLWRQSPWDQIPTAMKCFCWLFYFFFLFSFSPHCVHSPTRNACWHML